ncbi:hypothetical protein OR571_13090 [Psychrobacillus sp. NEAU-3TGS]|uniref:hypothetical protein n=1 Tax=Psychrobacillus sp. NEAU-3TGS TaxID=2995412 RepID=UPI002498BF69|nr:hypothetical protein [Psychrobacillus sp. NEAU-3TGS]MDI2588023.1 hypothetical protein [Psychrobacillus sp. NEAU-3TGS]
MNEEQKEKLNELADILKDKAPKEVILGAIEEIQNMNSEQLQGLYNMCEFLNKYEETTNH